MATTTVLRRLVLSPIAARCASLGAVQLCIGLWIRAKTVDQAERGNAERRALFVGLWPPLLWLMGDSLKDARRRSVRSGLRSRGAGRSR